MGTIADERQIHTQLLIGRPDGITWEDVTSYLARVEVNLGNVDAIGTGNSGVDAVVRQLTFTLRTDRQGADGDSFAPLDRTSAWNIFDVDGDGTLEYAPLLWENREVQFLVAVTDPGVTPASGDWIGLFHGYLGDSTRTSGTTVTADARDLAKRLQDTFIEVKRTYGSETGVAAEVVIQQILDDNLGTGVVTLYTPVSPGFMVTPYEVDYKSVWDAIQQVASQFGWFLGYWWDSGTSTFRLTLMEPPRDKDAESADFNLTDKDDFYINDLEITGANVRNAVTVMYRDEATGNMASVSRQDANSIAEYGRRASIIEEGNTLLINTLAEAERFAELFIHDLKDLTGTSRLQMPLLPELNVFAGITIQHSRVSSTTDFYGVESVRHTLDFEGGQFRTEVVATGRVIGAHIRWLEMETRPGSPGEPVRGSDIERGGIDTDRIADLSVVDAKILNLDAEKITSGQIAADRLTANVIEAINANIGEASIDAAVIGELDASQITSGNIDTDRLIANVIEAINANIGDATIDGAIIQEATIGSAQIDSAAIKAAHIDAEAVGAAHIQAAAIQTAHIQDLSVTTLKIGDLVITEEKLADLAVSEGKLQDAAVTTTKLGDGAVTTSKLGDGSVTDVKVLAGSISEAKMNWSSHLLF